MSAAELHVPVMLAEVIGLLTPALESPRTGSAADDCASGSCSRDTDARSASGSCSRDTDARSAPYLVDCTLGLGGHAHALLAACPEARLIGLDRDPQALALASERLAEFADRITLVEAAYDELPAVLAGLGRQKVQGILLDLGISSLQIDDPERGFAYAQDAPLDMRMGRQDLTAAEVLNTYSRAELSRILRTYGEERYADQIARRIVAEREREPFVTSSRLVQLLYDTVPAASRKTGGHPAKRTFQALRIEVNAELESLESVLPSAIAALALDGRIAVLAYHSLEDRLVKQMFGIAAQDRAPRDLPVVPADLRPELRLLTRGALRPSPAEIARNPRAASARLRAAVRISEMAVAG
jgi:16S rRNA (cytosine1402-N4)-methyltransferase